jgi:predicted phosphoribosyltransferase/dienelactone hydrolase
VAAEVAKELQCPLDVLVVRKLGAPSQPELAIGAIAEGGEVLLNEKLIEALRCSSSYVNEITKAEKLVLQHRVSRFRSGREPLNLTDKEVIIVDDGLATGVTARAACQYARKHGAKKITVAVPVASMEAANTLHEADDVVFLHAPLSFYAVGMHYADFAQTSDDEVRALLDEADSLQAYPHSEVEIPVHGATIQGSLCIPSAAEGIVVFAHGSGSSRHSPRNRHVARVLNKAGLATLLIDLLTPVEEANREQVFDIDLLTRRLTEVVRWVKDQPTTSRLNIGLFGASTGAAAALATAADSYLGIAAVVSRGGRPDLAGDLLAQVDAPTQFIVGEKDEHVLELNKKARERVNAITDLEIIPGATHLFQEAGTLDDVARLALGLFLRFCTSSVTRVEIGVRNG